jgi:AraC-like DNA-binding protein
MKALLPPLGSLARPFGLDFVFNHDHAMELVAATHKRARPAQYDAHEAFELGMVLKGGEIRIFPDGTEFRVLPGEVWLHPTWELHGHAILEDRTDVVVLLFLPDFLGEQLLGDVPWISLFSLPPRQRPRVTDDRMRARVLDIGRRLWNECYDRQPGWQTVTQLELVLLLIELRRACVAAQGAGVYVRDLSLILPVLSALHVDPTRWITQDEAAALTRVSRSCFSRTFRRSTGLSFHQFLVRTRTTQAADRLLYSNVPVEAAAIEFGFVDASHLHRHFVKQFNCTPAQYRRRLRT